MQTTDRFSKVICCFKKQESYRYSSGVSARDICVFINHIMILLHVDHDDDDDDVDDEDLYDYSTAL